MGKSNNDNVIRCHAKNCEYHSGDCICTADKIDVGNKHASHSAETECSTFKCKGGSDGDCDG